MARYASYGGHIRIRPGNGATRTCSGSGRDAAAGDGSAGTISFSLEYVCRNSAPSTKRAACVPEWSGEPAHGVGIRVGGLRTDRPCSTLRGPSTLGLVSGDMTMPVNGETSGNTECPNPEIKMD